MQLAMNNLTSASHNLIVESESTPSGLSSTGAIQVAVDETLSPEAPELASVSSLNENSNMAPPIAAAIESVMVSGSISSNSLVVIPGGAGRYDLAGPVAVSLGQRKIQGSLDSASWLNIETEPDIDGRRRIDALLIIDLPDFAQADIRLPGFGLGTRRSMEFEGFFGPMKIGNSMGRVSRGRSLPMTQAVTCRCVDSVKHAAKRALVTLPARLFGFPTHGEASFARWGCKPKSVAILSRFRALN